MPCPFFPTRTFVTGEKDVASCLTAVSATLRQAQEQEKARCSLLTSNVLEYIRLHVHEGIGAKDVIDWLALKRRTAEARFRRAVGRSILDEIKSVRLEQAELLLVNPGLSIETVASLVGYVAKNQLARLFKAAHGMTPRAWRKQS